MKLHENTLFLETRGCDFWQDDEIRNISNVGNYRVGTYDYSIESKDGIKYILEFGEYDKMRYRKENKRTGAPLKKPVYELVKRCALRIDTQFENEKGCWRNSKLERELHDLLLEYTLENILTVVNMISKKQYNKIVLLFDESIKTKINYIYSIGGWREKDVIENLEKVVKKQCDKDYYIVTFISSNGNTFDYNMKTNRITG